ncbi:hypothetical protein B0H14DRAFT_2571832 [Mycena olivaceomarginata]|nr:hypothetical protein B0H14DRAFT_2571832 [Mycena olivaceomarginata]
MVTEAMVIGPITICYHRCRTWEHRKVICSHQINIHMNGTASVRLKVDEENVHMGGFYECSTMEPTVEAPLTPLLWQVNGTAVRITSSCVPPVTVTIKGLKRVALTAFNTVVFVGNQVTQCCIALGISLREANSETRIWKYRITHLNLNIVKHAYDPTSQPAFNGISLVYKKRRGVLSNKVATAETQPGICTAGVTEFLSGFHFFFRVAGTGLFGASVLEDVAGGKTGVGRVGSSTVGAVVVVTVLTVGRSYSMIKLDSLGLRKARWGGKQGRDPLYVACQLFKYMIGMAVRVLSTNVVIKTVLDRNHDTANVAALANKLLQGSKEAVLCATRFHRSKNISGEPAKVIFQLLYCVLADSGVTAVSLA